MVTLGNGWIPFQGYNESLDNIAAKTAQLREAMAAAGRDPSTLDVAYWMHTFGRSIPEVLEDIPAMAAAGVTVAELLFTGYCEKPEDAPRVLEEIAVRLSAARPLAPT